MAHDLFISYARGDNEHGHVARLVERVQMDFQKFAGRKLGLFFDVHPEDGIKGMDDWRQKIQRGLRESHLFLAVLSPNYLASPYCRWEWEDYVRYEAMRQCLGEGVAPVFFVTLPDAATPQDDQTMARWIDEIEHRQTFDLRPWHDQGDQALQQAHVRTTLEQLHTSVRERLDRAERARRSPNNLIKHNPAFVGRVSELTDVRNALTRNKLGVAGARQGTSTGPVTVQGLGGMGKTELALAYAHAFAWDYPGGRWQVPCEYTGDLRLALSRLAGPMKFEFTEDEKKDLAMQFERVLRELRHRERCLLILDNVSDPHLLEPEYLDRLPRDGHLDLIATTRLAPTAIPGSASDSTFIAVDELPEEDALALLRSHQAEGHFASPDEDNEARQIICLLRGFTLAVETAAIYLGRHPAADACRRFRERLSPDLLRESEQAATDPTVAVRHRVRSLEETTAFTLQTLNPEVRHLLDYASLLPADQMAVPWLRALGAERYPTFQNNAGNAFNQALDLLIGLRLFQPTSVVEADGKPLVVRVHRLVQELVLLQCPNLERAARQRAVDDLIVVRTAALDSVANWVVARWELEPLTALAGLWVEMKHAQSSWLFNECGRRWQTIAEWSRAESLLRRALAIDKRSFGPGHTDVARDLNNLASLLQATNRLGEAEPLLRRALAIDEKNSGSESPIVAIRLNNLALMLQATNRLAEAEHLMRRVLMIWEKSLGAEHPYVAGALVNLAQLLQAINQLDKAEPLMRRALTIDEKNFGPNHFKVATDLNHLAQLFQATNRPAEAEPLMRRALAIYEKSFGADHPNVATSLNNLARLYRGTDRLNEAEPLIRKALAIDERNFGPTHPNVAIRLNNLADLLGATSRQGEAERLMRRALAIDEKSYGPAHPEVALRLHNLGALLLTADHASEAEALLKRATEILLMFTASTGHQHPNLQTFIEDYGESLTRKGRTAQEVMAQLNAMGKPFGIQFG